MSLTPLWTFLTIWPLLTLPLLLPLQLHTINTTDTLPKQLTIQILALHCSLITVYVNKILYIICIVPYDRKKHKKNMIERKEKNQTSSAYSFTKKIGLLFKTKFHFA